MDLARQIDTLVSNGYRALLGLTEDEFRGRLADLPPGLAYLLGDVDTGRDTLDVTPEL